MSENNPQNQVLKKGCLTRIIALGLGVIVALVIWFVANAAIKEVAINEVAVEEAPQIEFSPIGDSFYVSDDWLVSRHGCNQEGGVPEKYWTSPDKPIVQHTDNVGRRVTVQPADQSYDSFVLFAPDSMVYGINVEDRHTLPSLFAEKVAGENIKVYNYGVSGWGPGNFLSLMTDPRFPAEISEKRGIVIYSLNDWHIFRAACWSFLFQPDHSYRLPKYILDENDQVKRLGIVDSGENEIKDPSQSPQKGQLQFDLYNDGVKWLLLSKDHFRLTARLILEAKKEFEKRFKSLGFVVMILPDGLYAKPMTSILQDSMEIPCLDYRHYLNGPRGYKDCGNEKCMQEENGHPTISGNRLLADKLYEDLKRMNIIPVPPVSDHDLPQNETTGSLLKSADADESKP